jgi:hypothetical protein
MLPTKVPADAKDITGIHVPALEIIAHSRLKVSIEQEKGLRGSCH